nr:prepilin-type N-terminal cleavage/methylation domain-containing protein [Bacteriovorax sp. HI3]
MSVNQRGFSLTEILIGMGLLSVLSLGVASMMKNMMSGQVTSETKMEELEMRRILTTTLADKKACENTFKNFSLGQVITQIKNSSGAIIYEVGKKYGNNSLAITSMKTEDTNIVGSDGTRTVELVVTLERMKKMAIGKVKNFTIQLQVVAATSTGPISSCFSDAESYLKDGCLSLGGVWSDSGVRCALPSCPAGQLLQDINSSGGAVCRTLTCPAGLSLNGLDATGAPVCTAPTYQ